MNCRFEGASMTRLDRLRQVREGLEDRCPRPTPQDLFAACLPEWRADLFRGNDVSPSSYGLVQAGGENSAWVLNPYVAVDGALWLAKQALPDRLWPPFLQPEGTGEPAQCQFFTHFPSPTYRGSAPTLPIAICRAVVAALIAQAEREAGLSELARLGQEFDAHDG